MVSFGTMMRIKQKLNSMGKERWGDPYLDRLNHFVIPSSILGAIIVSDAPWPTLGSDTDIEWIHASISRHNHMPTYEDLKMMHRAVFNNGWAYQIFAPKERHVNVHEYTLHLFGRADGKPQHPDFQAISGINTI